MIHSTTQLCAIDVWKFNKPMDCRNHEQSCISIWCMIHREAPNDPIYKNNKVGFCLGVMIPFRTMYSLFSLIIRCVHSWFESFLVDLTVPSSYTWFMVLILERGSSIYSHIFLRIADLYFALHTFCMIFQVSLQTISYN